MKAFDTDILTELLEGNPVYAERIENVPLEHQWVPVIVVEEILRGRLDAVRKSEGRKSRITIDQAYKLFEETLDAICELRLLSFTSKSEAIFKEWRKKKIRGSTHDLRIAASCVAHSVTLVTRNRRDFEHIPGLVVEFWEDERS
jgi:predicted nucleic acid-binding protein